MRVASRLPAAEQAARVTQEAADGAQTSPGFQLTPKQALPVGWEGGGHDLTDQHTGGTQARAVATVTLGYKRVCSHVSAHLR